MDEGVPNMNRMIALLLMALPFPAVAGQCDHWTASMQEDEGGPVMMANICAPAGKTNHELLMNCGGEGKLSIRYLPAEFLPAVSGYKTDIEFSFDQEMFTRPAQYEEMDGALVVDIDIDSPFFSVLQSQKQMMLSDTAGKAPGATFTLKGSKAALAKLIATCSKQ